MEITKYILIYISVIIPAWMRLLEMGLAGSLWVKHESTFFAFLRLSSIPENSESHTPSHLYITSAYISYIVQKYLSMTIYIVYIYIYSLQYYAYLAGCFSLVCLSNARLEGSRSPQWRHTSGTPCRGFPHVPLWRFKLSFRENIAPQPSHWCWWFPWCDLMWRTKSLRSLNSLPQTTQTSQDMASITMPKAEMTGSQWHHTFQMTSSPLLMTSSTLSP